MADDLHKSDAAKLGHEGVDSLIDEPEKPAIDIDAIQKRIDYVTGCLKDGKYPNLRSALATYGGLKETAKQAGLADEEIAKFSPGKDPIISAVCHSIKDLGTAIIGKLTPPDDPQEDISMDQMEMTEA